jgi:hypothetical protein
MRMPLVWAWLIIYLGIGILSGAAIMLLSTNMNVARAVGGGIALGGIALYLYASWKQRHKEDVPKEGQ